MSHPDEIIAGIDEAGRGAVLGPLVVACVFLKSSQCKELELMGVQDSKKFGSPAAAKKKRMKLAEQIELVSVAALYECASAQEVDLWVKRKGLNRLEQKMASALMSRGPRAARVFADGQKVFSPLSAVHKGFMACDKADETICVVAAASIIAKHRRDCLITQILQKYSKSGEKVSGGGYVNSATERLLKDYHSAHGCLPPETRLTWSWEVIRRLSGPKEQLELDCS